MAVKTVCKKQHLPSKQCAVCLLPFTWRKKWAKCWDEVKYCSKRCRNKRHQGSCSPEYERKWPL
ncbi:DUF2256 domain-containing protein [Vibrio sp. TBV020]|uniref:DUF2256 domain-containing protein n=1 Tax=Vibrio sp. TBV020 TaxID=3137398 RepID=UPI0038CD4D96